MRENKKIRLKLLGKQFNRWTVLEFSHISKHRNTMWLCKCSCGTTRVVMGGALTSGASKSCGCLKAERASEIHGLSWGVASKNALFDRYKKEAYKRGLAFELSFPEFELFTKKNCYYCGIEPKQEMMARGCNGNYIYNGIDRIDNTIGYIMNNCVPCCKTCNVAKHHLSLSDFYAWIDRLIEHRKLNKEMEELGIPK